MLTSPAESDNVYRSVLSSLVLSSLRPEFARLHREGQRLLISFKMDEVRSKDSSISKNIDFYFEELKREQAARQKETAEHDAGMLVNYSIEATSLDDREGASGEGEEDWEEEYVMLDLDDVFRGAPVPSSAYTLSGLDTLHPILTLDNGLKLIGHYTETIGTVVVYSEKEIEAQSELADPSEKKSLKRVRGLCKLERKLKFCAMPIASAPARDGRTMGDVSFMKTGTEDASLPIEDGNAMPIENAARLREIASLNAAGPEENATLGNERPMENALIEHTEPANDGAVENAEVAMLTNGVAEDESSRPALEDARPVDDITAMEDT